MHNVHELGFKAIGVALAAVVVVAAGCSQTDPASGTGATSGSTASTQPAAACVADPRIVAYAPGIEAKSVDGAITVRFVTASPDPPAKGNNTWTVQVLDAANKPVNGATITTKGFMPDHGHGTTIKPTSTPKGTDGTYEITPVSLFMPGVWEMTFTVEAPGVSDAAVVTFCVEGWARGSRCSHPSSDRRRHTRRGCPPRGT